MTIRRAIVFGLLLALAGQIAYGQDEGAEAADSNERVCLNSRALRDFDAIDDRHVVVREGSSRYYLLTMARRCIDLRDARTIAISDATSRVCSDGFSEIIYRDRISRRLDKCRIDTIEAVESEEDAEAIVAARKEAKE